MTGKVIAINESKEFILDTAEAQFFGQQLALASRYAGSRALADNCAELSDHLQAVGYRLERFGVEHPEPVSGLDAQTLLDGLETIREYSPHEHERQVAGYLFDLATHPPVMQLAAYLIQ